MTENNEQLIDDIAGEVTKRLSAVIEDFQSQLSGVAEQVSANTEKLNSVSKQVSTNTEKIDAVSKQVSTNTEKIDENRNMIAQVAEDVTDIKQELKKKVDYEEFDALKKRVVELEQEVANK